MSNGGRDKRHKYERISLSDLRQGRLGKHHKLLEHILKELAALPEGQALKIPLNSLSGVSKVNLRSAITRATASRAMQVSTYSDSGHFYVWNRTSSSAPYERKQKRRVK